MYKYKAFGLNIHSEIFLPELIHHKSKNPDISILEGRVNLPSESILEGKNFKVTENNVYMFWKDIGKFEISNGNEILIEKVQDVNRLVLRSFVLGNIMTAILIQRGFLVLHASAVNINNEAIAFIGNKGYGKSTTAMTFYKEGYQIVADDYIMIKFENGLPFVYPGFPSLRLSYKSRKYGDFSLEKVFYKNREIEKIYVPTKNNFSLNKLPLKKLYVLKRGKYLKISDIELQDSLIKLVENTFGITRFNESDSIKHLHQCSLLLKKVNILLLEVPDSLEELYKLVKFIKKDVKE
jgi:hypothetical protein